MRQSESWRPRRTIKYFSRPDDAQLQNRDGVDHRGIRYVRDWRTAWFPEPRPPDTSVEGGSGWINSESYTINAKAEDRASAYRMLDPMLQTLPENRLKLKIHRETREIATYNLVVAKGGPKFKPFEEGSCTPRPALEPGKTPVPPPALPPGQHYCRISGGAAGPNFQMDAEGITLDDFVSVFLSGERPVVNTTGITGKFDIHLEFGLDDSGRQRTAELRSDPGEPAGPVPFLARSRSSLASSWKRRRARASSW